MIIRHYHTDNGRFSDNTFIKSVNTQGQTISYYGFNTQFQNGISEKRIRDLQYQGRIHILHTKSILISAIELKQWPYALQNANLIKRNLPNKDDTNSPVQRYYQEQVSPKIRCHHNFVCPEYAPRNFLQAVGRHPHWESRPRIGINLIP